MTEEKKNRHLSLNGDVSESSVESIIKDIQEINRHDDEKEKKEIDYVREPIHLMVNTYGGSIYDGFALVAAMELSKTPIHTYCLGKAMSMGFMIMIAGDKRYAHPFATLMYHDGASWNIGTTVQQERSLAEMKRLDKIYDDYVLKRTNLLQEKLDSVKLAVDNWFISAEDAKKLGIIDELLTA